MFIFDYGGILKKKVVRCIAIFVINFQSMQVSSVK